MSNPSIDTKLVRTMASTAREVHEWAIKMGLKKPGQIEQMARAIEADLKDAGVTVARAADDG